MDIFIVLVSVAFIGFVSVFAFQFLEERRAAPAAAKTHKKDPQAELLSQFKRRTAEALEKLKKLEYEAEAWRLELAQTKEREKALLNERSLGQFDSAQYEKFKKEFQELKKDLSSKEQALEKEISLRRAQSSELAASLDDARLLKKQLAETQDVLRKTQSIAENLSKELTAARRTIDEQNKVVLEHKENKMGGEWVSRAEFEKVERELREKEAMIQKFLALKKTGQP